MKFNESKEDVKELTIDSKIKSILDEKNIDFNVFSNVYDEVTLTSKKQSQ